MASVVISALYVCVVAGFDGFDRHRQVMHVDSRLEERLDQATHVPSRAADADNFDNTHDADDAPVFLWKAGTQGQPVALTAGAPKLVASDLPPSGGASVVHLGAATFRLQTRQIAGETFVAGQSLAEADHLGGDLLTLEVLAGPLLFIAVFLGTFLVGVKAASPVELARRRQLEFTADASHELRTPLSVIEAEVSLARTGQRQVKEYQDTLSRVARESQRLRVIVDDLLWLARFDSEPPPPSDEPVDVAAIAAACADRFDSVAKGRGIALSVASDGEEHKWIDAPPEWIDRLTAVLVDNACRYAGWDGVVQLRVSTLGNRVSLAVDDSGPGIAPEARGALFDRFHRATDEGNGAGLGLAIGDAVVRATGGEWRIGDSNLGGAHMEIRWHRSHSAKGVVDPKAIRPTTPASDSGRTDSPVIG